MIRGIVIGKFYPPHAGHKYLVDTALCQVDHLTIILCEQSNETIPGALRAQWLREIHPGAEVKLLNWDGLDPDDSRLWADLTFQLLGYRPEVVFTSEEYGERFARFLGSKHVLIDRDRQVHPISGTAVRANPLAAWEFLEPPVRAYFAKRVVLLGAESTGTTTLAGELARHYKTCWVPEYGRLYYEARMHSRLATAWDSKDFEFIARQQNALEDELAKWCNKVLICDTDSFATTVWHQRYMNCRSPEVEKVARDRKYDLYILTDVDIPFVQDGTRDGKSIREWMHRFFIEELEEWYKSYIVVSGSLEVRLRESIQAIEQLIK